MTAEPSKTTGLICVPITENSPESFLKAIDEASGVADIIELRADYLADRHPINLLMEIRMRRYKGHSFKPLILTYRPREQGGQLEIRFNDRLRFWRRLDVWEDQLDYLDIELDMVERLAQTRFAIPWNKVICSWHNFNETPANVDEIFDRMARTPAAVIKIATQATRLTDCLKIFELIERAKKLPEPKPVIALGMGLPGVATRVLALSRGALLTFGALRRGAESASGQPTVEELRYLYRADRLTRNSQVMGVIGNPIGHSRSPLIHNTALAALGLDAVYLPFEVDDVGEFVRDFVRPATRRMDWPMRGLSVTIPHKLSIMPHLDFIDPTAQQIGAVNTVVVEGDELHGYNTDVIGAMNPLAALTELRDARVAVLGAGGAARAICYGLNERGAKTTVYARDVRKAQTLAAEFNAQAASLDEFRGGADIVINCTPVGMQGHGTGNSPVTIEQLKGVRLVYDLIYNPLETQLLKDAEAAGCQTLGGMAMLIGQAAEQFRLWTGREAPLELMMKTALTAAA